MATRVAAGKAGWLSSVAAVAAVLTGCGSFSNGGAPQQTTVDGQRATPVSVAKHVAGMRMAALTGDQKALQAHVDGLSKEMLHDAHIPDPTRPIPH